MMSTFPDWVNRKEYFLNHFFSSLLKHLGCRRLHDRTKNEFQAIGWNLSPIGIQMGCPCMLHPRAACTNIIFVRASNTERHAINTHLI